MLNARLTAAHRIADALSPTEADVEAAIASTSRLIGAIAEGRRETRVSMSIGQDSLAALADALAGLVQARANIVAAHAALAEDRARAGLSAYAMGDLGDCPKTATLVVVEEARSAA